MHLDHYHLTTGRNSLSFEFVSIGPTRQILKTIKFDPTETVGIFNLSLGDKDFATGIVDYSAISNNQDTEKVLATVISAIYAFTDRFPSVWVFAEGNSPSRTRLYQMGISKYIERANADFFILGQTNNVWEPLVYGKNYDAFVVKRK
jgi:hypothetical protein